MGKTTERRIGRPMASSREEVLKAADELLKSGGEQALSFRRLADKLGLSAPSIYTYFASKQDLLLALAESILPIGEPPSEQETAYQALGNALNHLRQSLLDKQHLMFLFGKVIPAKHMLGMIAYFASIVERQGISHDYAVRYGQSLIWITLGFVTFEINSRHSDVVIQFSELFEFEKELLPHLDLQSHERLWQETLERNLFFLKQPSQ